MTEAFFPSLAGMEATIETLHAYCKVVGTVPRLYADPHPRWWHISFKVIPDGLVTTNIRLPDGDVFHLRIDFWRDKILLVTTKGEQRGWDMVAGDSAHTLASLMFRVLAELGLNKTYDPEKFSRERPEAFNPEHAMVYWRAILAIEKVLRRRWNQISGSIGPIQLWPHGFDMSFEWFGTRQVEYEEGGNTTSHPSQINLGWSPGEASHPAPYFYSSPWPFDSEKLTSQTLPHGAHWVESPWQGSLLEYESLVGDPNAAQKVLDYAVRVFELAAPDLR